MSLGVSQILTILAFASHILSVLDFSSHIFSIIFFSNHKLTIQLMSHTIQDLRRRAHKNSNWQRKNFQVSYCLYKPLDVNIYKTMSFNSCNDNFEIIYSQCKISKSYIVNWKLFMSLLTFHVTYRHLMTPINNT